MGDLCLAIAVITIHLQCLCLDMALSVLGDAMDPCYPLVDAVRPHCPMVTACS
jgi:hypothetical protein